MCQIRAKVWRGAIMEGIYGQLMAMITAGERLPLKGPSVGSNPTGGTL